MSESFEFSVDAATVCDILNDPDFRVEQALALGEKSATCELDGDDDNWILKMERVVVRDNLPAAVAKTFGSEQHMTLTETWRATKDGWEGEHEINIKGAPVKVSAKFTLKNVPHGSVYDVSHKAKVSIPLIGGVVEKYIVKQIQEGLAADMRFTSDRLDED